VAGLCLALHGWFRLSINRFNSVAAKDVLAAWDAKLAKVSARTTVNCCALSHRSRSWKPL